MASRPALHWDGGPLFNQVQPIGRGPNSDMWQNDPSFPTDINGPMDGMDANFIHQGMIKPASETNGIQTYNMSFDYKGEKSQALLDRWGGDLIFAHELYSPGSRRHFDGAKVTINEGKCVSRLNMWLKSDAGRKAFPGNNAFELIHAWRNVGFQAQGPFQPQGVTVLSKIGYTRTRALVPYSKDGQGLYLLVVKKRISQIEAEATMSTTKKAINNRPTEQYTAGGGGGDGVSDMDVDKKINDAAVLLAEMDRLPTPKVTEKLIKDSRALISHSSKALAEFNDTKDDPDPWVWQFVPWVGRHHELPPPQLYNNAQWIGEYLFIATFWHYETGAATTGLEARHAEFYSPHDTTDRYREISQGMADISLQAHIW